ncbi:MAG: VWA domain-containing protein [Thiotrichales bacterium]
MNELTPGLQFAEPLWLLAVIVPALLWAWLRNSRPAPRHSSIERYADAELLPHLTGQTQVEGRSHWRRFGLWSGVWILSVIALAGPRWDFREERLYRPANELVVVLDLSRSMLIDDVRPTRHHRARQEIEDLVNLRPNLRLGLIAFASTAHVIAPLTDDHASLLRLLPSLTPELVGLPGSRLTRALQQAEFLLSQSGEGISRSILVISDGDIVESNLLATVLKSREKGIFVHVLGVGTARGDIVRDPGGKPLVDVNREPIRSVLNEDVLKAVAREGGGQYLVANFQDDDSRTLLRAIEHGNAEMKQDDGRVLIWNERYYLPLSLGLLVLLSWFRKTAPRSTV